MPVNDFTWSVKGIYLERISIKGNKVLRKRSERKGAGSSFFLSRIPSYDDRPEFLSASYLVKITSGGLPHTGFHGSGFLKVDTKAIGSNRSTSG